MDITAFIRELLFSHDCVIVPGFGGFIGNYSPARIDKETSMFHPPVKQISFNRNLNHNDGLLVGKVSGSAGIPYGDARTIIDEFSAGIRKRLEKGERITFDTIGSFINNQEGNVEFEPDRSVNYHLDSWGLESYNFPQLERYDVRKRISGHIDKEPVKRSITRKILWRAAVVVPILSLLVLVPLRTSLIKGKVEASTLNPLATAEFEENRAAIDKDKEAQSVSAEQNIGNLNVQPPVITLQVENKYCIITGSFQHKENAEKQARILSAEGYLPEIISGPNGFYRVSAVKCPDLSCADQNKGTISKKFPGSWVKKL
jgi:nucleoid DNA-binding protein